MIVDRTMAFDGHAAETGQRSVEFLVAAHLRLGHAAARLARGEAGVDLDQNRPLAGESVDRPDRQMITQAVQHAHPGKARFADLRGADEVTKEAQAINDTVGGWAYEVPYYKGNSLRTRLDDLLAKKKGS